MKFRLRPILTMLKLPYKYKFLVIKIWIGLGMARFSVLVFSFRKIASWIGVSFSESPFKGKNSETEYLNKLRKLLKATSKYTPWESNCYAQALCAAWILKQKNISHTIYFGLHKTNNKEMLAHAWLRSGTIFITGAPEHEKYTSAGSFMWIENTKNKFA